MSSYNKAKDLENENWHVEIVKLPPGTALESNMDVLLGNGTDLSRRI